MAMERIPFDSKELEVTGTYPQWANPMNPTGAADGKRNLPVTPKENFRLALTGHTPLVDALSRLEQLRCAGIPPADAPGQCGDPSGV